MSQSLPMLRSSASGTSMSEQVPLCTACVRMAICSRRYSERASCLWAFAMACASCRCSFLTGCFTAVWPFAKRLFLRFPASKPARRAILAAALAASALIASTDRAATAATRSRSFGGTRLMKTSHSSLNSRARFALEALPPPVAHPIWRGTRRGTHMLSARVAIGHSAPLRADGHSLFRVVLR
eukprot:7391945-Prymnesium_polylepis.2